MPVKIRLLLKRQDTWTVTRHIKLLPENSLEKVTKFSSVCSNIKKVINFQRRCGLNRVKVAHTIFNSFNRSQLMRW